MSKYEFKEMLGIIAFSILNIIIAYLVTTALEIQNIILYQTLSAMQYVITYEVLIFMALSFMECLVYHYKYEM